MVDEVGKELRGYHWGELVGPECSDFIGIVYGGEYRLGGSAGWSAMSVISVVSVISVIYVISGVSVIFGDKLP